MRRSSQRGPWVLAILVLACLVLAGNGACNAPGQPTFRVGALPYYGLALHARADAERLGKHRYWSPCQLFDGEVGRGIIYTQQAGFVDVAHIRDTADWTRYIARRVEAALAAGQTSLSLGGSDRTRVHLRFEYPAGWDALAGGERERLVHELALRVGQEAAYALTTWHELITWYDYGIVPLVSERHSAFTYDDVMSHVLGLYVVERAWHDRTRDYNAAMTVALSDVLRELGPATPKETRRAVNATKGWWWKRGSSIKRHLDTGLDDGQVVPMLIDGFTVASVQGEPASVGGAGKPFALPRVRDVSSAGLDFSKFLTLELEPRVGLYRKLRRRLDGAPDRIVPERDIPILMQTVRHEMQAKYGPFVDSLADRPALVLGRHDPIPRASAP